MHTDWLKILLTLAQRVDSNFGAFRIDSFSYLTINSPACLSLALLILNWAWQPLKPVFWWQNVGGIGYIPFVRCYVNAIR